MAWNPAEQDNDVFRASNITIKSSGESTLCAKWLPLLIAIVVLSFSQSFMLLIVHVDIFSWDFEFGFNRTVLFGFLCKVSELTATSPYWSVWMCSLSTQSLDLMEQ